MHRYSLNHFLTTEKDLCVMQRSFGKLFSVFLFGF